MSLQGYPELKRRFAAISGGQATRELMHSLGMAAIAEQALLAPRKTSNLQHSIHVKSLSSDSVLTVASVHYARYVEEGTRPHDITPKAKKALAWAATAEGRRLSGRPRSAARRGKFGGMIVRRRVHHPGTKAHPFMVPGAKKALAGAGLLKAVVQRWNDAA